MFQTIDFEQPFTKEASPLISKISYYTVAAGVMATAYSKWIFKKEISF